MDKQTTMPEAISSVTYSLTTPTGFNILFTVRDDSGMKLLETMTVIEKELVERKYTAQVKPTYGGFPKKEIAYVEGRKCPTCTQPLVYATKKDGSKYIKCSTNKWNALTKQAEGCPFVEWPKEEFNY